VHLILRSPDFENRLFSTFSLRPRVEVVSCWLEVTTGNFVRSRWGATCPLIYQLRVAAGKELWEVQLAMRISLGLYMGCVPLIVGPSSGKSTTISTLVLVAVWNSGASPDTSHLNFPLVVRSTFLRTILVSVDSYSSTMSPGCLKTTVWGLSVGMCL